MISTVVHNFLKTARRNVDQFIAPSRYVRDIHVDSGFPADRISIKPNTSDLEYPPSLGRRHILYLGRFGPVKGLADLLDAWQRSSARKTATLRMVGSGPMKDELVLRAADDSSIEFPGVASRDAAAAEIANACVVVVPSTWPEPFGRSVIEAFAAGVPVVAAKSGALPELVEDGVNGFLFDPGDVGALASAIDRCVSDPSFCRAAGRSARQRFGESFAPATTSMLLARIYQRAIDVRWHGHDSRPSTVSEGRATAGGG